MQLLDVVEEAEHAFREQCRGVFVVVRESVVSEKVSIAAIQEQLCALHCLVELAGDVGDIQCDSRGKSEPRPDEGADSRT